MSTDRPSAAAVVGLSSGQRVAKSDQCAAKKHRGLTLFELLVSMSIFSVVTAIAVPSFQHITASNSLATDTNELVASMQHARSEAVTRGQNVTICAADSTLAACSGLSNWATGWIVLDSGGNIIRVHEALSTNALVEIGAVGTLGGVVFNRNGFTNDARTIRLCGPNKVATRARGVVVSVDGRVRLASDSNSNHVVEDRSGAELSCP